MPTDIITGFVDRFRELDQFLRMLAGETNERILLILEAAEQGKTYFLLRLAHECERQTPPIPIVLLDFDQRRSALTDYLSVAREVRRYLGDDLTPSICTCEEAMVRRHLVNVQTGTGNAGVDWGERGRFDEADISKIAGRDYVSIGSVSGSLLPPDPAKQEADMGRAMCSDLVRLADAHRRVVVLLDTFDHASSETCRWLEHWLFEPLRRELGHIVLVVTGRPDCQPFFERPRLWGELIATIDRFTPLSDEDILTHYRQRRLTVSEGELPLLLDLARSSPARMAQVGDWLARARGR